MAVIAMIIGQSGTGKSASLRNFKKGEVAVINVSGKPFPFKEKPKSVVTDDYEKIKKAMETVPEKTIVIDDATYLMTDEFMRTAKVNGFQKFTDMALNFFNLVKFAAYLPEDKTVYFLGHVEQSDDGREKFKTIGKLLDEKVTLEGLFTVVLKTVVKDGKYLFQTHNNGMDTVKSPFGMFEEDLIDNDLKAVDKAIRDYWGLDKNAETKS